MRSPIRSSIVCWTSSTVTSSVNAFTLPSWNNRVTSGLGTQLRDTAQKWWQVDLVPGVIPYRTRYSSAISGSFEPFGSERDVITTWDGGENTISWLRLISPP